MAAVLAWQARGAEGRQSDNANPLVAVLHQLTGSLNRLVSVAGAHDVNLGPMAPERLQQVCAHSVPASKVDDANVAGDVPRQPTPVLTFNACTP